MQELDKLNPHKGTATDAMALFLAINTSSVTLLPTGVIALRAAAGSSDPAGILPTTLFATTCSTGVAILAARSEEHTSELQSLMRISYAVFCLQKQTLTLLKNQVLKNHTPHRIKIQTQRLQHIHQL